MTRDAASKAIINYFKMHDEVYNETVEDLISWIGYRGFLTDHLVDVLEENRGLIKTILDDDELTVLFDELEIAEE